MSLLTLSFIFHFIPNLVVSDQLFLPVYTGHYDFPFVFSIRYGSNIKRIYDEWLNIILDEFSLVGFPLIIWLYRFSSLKTKSMKKIWIESETVYFKFHFNYKAINSLGEHVSRERLSEIKPLTFWLTIQPFNVFQFHLTLQNFVIFLKDE